MFFPNYGFRKTCLTKCLSTTVPDDPSTSNKVRVTKRCRNLIYTTLTKFIDHRETN